MSINRRHRPPARPHSLSHHRARARAPGGPSPARAPPTPPPAQSVRPPRSLFPLSSSLALPTDLGRHWPCAPPRQPCVRGPRAPTQAADALSCGCSAAGCRRPALLPLQPVPDPALRVPAMRAIRSWFIMKRRSRCNDTARGRPGGDERRLNPRRRPAFACARALPPPPPPLLVLVPPLLGAIAVHSAVLSGLPRWPPRLRGIARRKRARQGSG